MTKIPSKAVLYKSFGDPKKVLELTTTEVSSEPKEGELLLKWLASPVNPLDINRVQGAYAVRAPLPCIGGSEGCARVVKAGPGSKFREGDLVCARSSIDVPFWTEYSIVYEDSFLKLDKRISVPVAATFMINPPTAWVMLRYFVKLEKGDYIIQNASNSGVGRSVIELCKAWGIRSINIVRNRPEIEALKSDLWRIGADHVFTEEEFMKQGREFIKTLSAPPRLALNGVGGRSVLSISSVLERGGTCVVYGGMSKKAHEFSTSALVFNDIRVRGIAIGLWMTEPENEQIMEGALAELQELAVAGKITAPPMDRVNLDDFKLAIQRTMDGGHLKQLLVMDRNESKL